MIKQACYECDCDKILLFVGRTIEIPLVSQGKRNHNTCGVRLYCGSEVVREYRLNMTGP
jgi:hypothetical protein